VVAGFEYFNRGIMLTTLQPSQPGSGVGEG
jgi:hypothetical protein